MKATHNYALLRNCYDTDLTSNTFGQRNDETEPTMVADGHKCPYPVTIRTKPAGGEQSWDLDTVNATHDYDVCFTLTDPGWPYVNDATNQFVPASTRVSYQVICDSAIQDESFGDCVNKSAVACTRLGGKQNPCDHMGSKDDDFFEIVVCDNDNCDSLEISEEEGGVVSYDFAIDPLQTQNLLNNYTQ